MRTKTSKYKGVSKSNGKWRVRIKDKTIGLYKDELMAARVYNRHSTKPNQLAKKFVCVKCEFPQLREKFPIDRRKITGISSICKQCHTKMAAINKDLVRAGLAKTKDSLKYLSTRRILKLIDEKIITKDEGRRIYNKDAPIDRAYSIRFTRKMGTVTGNPV